MRNPILILLALAASANFAAAEIRDVDDTADRTADDWKAIRRIYEENRHAFFKQADGGIVARNPGQQWRTLIDSRGFIVEPEHGAWSWGLELISVGEQSLRDITPEIVVNRHRLSRRWTSGIEEWFINDWRGLEQGWTIAKAPARERGDAAFPLLLALRGELTVVVTPDGRSVQLRNGEGATVAAYGGLKAWDALGLPLGVRFSWDEAARILEVSVNDIGAVYPIVVDPIATHQATLKASNGGGGFGGSVAVSGDGNTIVVGARYENSDATGVDGDQSDNSAIASGAAYVFVHDGINWSQQAYLKASNTDPGDEFGASVAISGDGKTIVVGAYFESSDATGVNGDENDNSAPFSGAAYVFVRDEEGWNQQSYIKASNTDRDDGFGQSVAIYGDTIVVGAPLEDSAASGVNGDQADNGAAGSGAAYVFVRDGGSWSQQAYLKASNTDGGDRFGGSLAIFGDTVVVGAFGEDSASTGINGDQSDNSAVESGAAYVFVRDGRSWSQQAYLKASNADPYDNLGESVAISDETLVAGARGEAGDATGVNGDQSDNSALSAGSAYVFVRDGESWSQQAYLKASNTDPQDEFGGSVAISGDTVVVGSEFEGSDAHGIDGDQNDNSSLNSGAAYVFRRNDGSWSQEAYLKVPSGDGLEYFGFPVAISGGTIVVGALADGGTAYVLKVVPANAPPLWSNGYPAKDVAMQDGLAYVTGPRLGLAVVDLENVGEPTAVGILDDVGGDNVDVSNGILVLSHMDIFGIVDVADPDAPILVKAWRIDGSISQLRLRGDRLYLLTGQKEIWIIDISDPLSAQIVHRDSYDSGTVNSRIDDFDVEGALMGHVDGLDMGLQLYELADSAPPVHVAAVSPSPWGVTRLDITPGFAHVTWGAAAEEFMEYRLYETTGVGAATGVIPVGALPLPHHAPPVELRAAGSTVYVASAEGGVEALDIGDRTTPTIVHTYPAIGIGPNALASDSSRLVVATDLGLFVLPGYGAIKRLPATVRFSPEGHFVIEFPTEEGKAYQLLYSSNLADPFAAIDSLVGTGRTESFEVTSLPGKRGFYRVKQL